MEYTIYVTAENGDVAKVTGPQAAIDAVIAALKARGIWFNETVQTWDCGFYHSSSVKERRERLTRT